jgi:hypothetical protein
MNQRDCTALPKIKDVCQDEIEMLAISIGRFIIAGYVTGDVACWDAGHDRAETSLGFIDGPRLVRAWRLSFGHYEANGTNLGTLCQQIAAASPLMSWASLNCWQSHVLGTEMQSSKEPSD